jgi:hypothetical protein
MGWRERLATSGLPLGGYFEGQTPSSTFPGASDAPRATVSAPSARAAGIERQPAGAGPVGQGTVVGSPGVGTIDGPKQSPPMTETGGTEQVNIEHTTVQVRGWPPNPAQRILSPGGRRQEQITTDHELQTGEAPGKVLRQLFSRVFGSVGDDGGHAFPYNAEWSLVPHLYVPREAQRTGPTARTYDDAAPIPSVYAGNPR